jgi:hypothetical protein
VEYRCPILTHLLSRDPETFAPFATGAHGALRVERTTLSFAAQEVVLSIVRRIVADRTVFVRSYLRLRFGKWETVVSLFLLKNVLSVGNGRRMIVAETCSWVGQ